ncbi:serine hydrolase [Pseudoalteromonas piscicida]|uniref:serine hydrolase n=1 Tax=Pseudoalteromonas piscicida TaxID=43662 RepID=UPI003097F3F8
MLKWDNVFYAQDPYWRDIASRLQQPGMLNNGEPTEYGLGLEFGRYRGQPIVFHDGCWGGYLSQYLRFPEQQLAVVVLSNYADGDPMGLAESIADIVLADTLFDEQVLPECERREAFSELMLQALPGTYEFLHEPENDFEIVRNGDQITLLFGNEQVLYHAGDGHLVNEAGLLTVVFDMQQNKVVSWLGARTGKAFKVRKIKYFQPSKVDLNILVGFYFSEELDTGLEITQNERELVMISGEEVYKLEYYESDLLKTSHEDIKRLRIQKCQETVSLFTGVHNVLNIEFVKA